MQLAGPQRVLPGHRASRASTHAAGDCTRFQPSGRSPAHSATAAGEGGDAAPVGAPLCGSVRAWHSHRALTVQPLSTAPPRPAPAPRPAAAQTSSAAAPVAPAPVPQASPATLPRATLAPTATSAAASLVTAT
jgi:hypothetical protein